LWVVQVLVSQCRWCGFGLHFVVWESHLVLCLVLCLKMWGGQHSCSHIVSPFWFVHWYCILWCSIGYIGYTGGHLYLWTAPLLAPVSTMGKLCLVVVMVQGAPLSLKFCCQVRAQGLVKRSQPYRNDQIIAAIQGLFFSGRETLFATCYRGRFMRVHEDSSISYEVPMPLLSLVATGVSSEILGL